MPQTLKANMLNINLVTCLLVLEVLTFSAGFPTKLDVQNLKVGDGIVDFSLPALDKNIQYDVSITSTENGPSTNATYSGDVSVVQMRFLMIPYSSYVLNVKINIGGQEIMGNASFQTGSCEIFSCQPRNYKYNGFVCISPLDICDGELQCLFGEDENSCNSAIYREDFCDKQLPSYLFNATKVDLHVQEVGERHVKFNMSRIEGVASYKLTILPCYETENTATEAIFSATSESLQVMIMKTNLVPHAVHKAVVEAKGLDGTTFGGSTKFFTPECIIPLYCLSPGKTLSTCLTEEIMCDGVEDCWDGTDEQHCELFQRVNETSKNLTTQEPDAPAYQNIYNSSIELPTNLTVKVISVGDGFVEISVSPISLQAFYDIIVVNTFTDEFGRWLQGPPVTSTTLSGDELVSSVKIMFPMMEVNKYIVTLKTIVGSQELVGQAGFMTKCCTLNWFFETKCSVSDSLLCISPQFICDNKTLCSEGQDEAFCEYFHYQKKPLDPEHCYWNHNLDLAYGIIDKFDNGTYYVRMQKVERATSYVVYVGYYAWDDFHWLQLSQSFPATNDDVQVMVLTDLDFAAFGIKISVEAYIGDRYL